MSKAYQNVAGWDRAADILHSDKGAARRIYSAFNASDFKACIRTYRRQWYQKNLPPLMWRLIYHLAYLDF